MGSLTDDSPAFPFRTTDALDMIHRALEIANKEKDKALEDDAVSLMSVVALNLRNKYTLFPAAVRGNFNRVTERTQ